MTHPTSDTPPKQLQMLWPEHLIDLSPDSLSPAQALPDGYQLRTYRPEDESGYLAVMHAAGFTSFDHQAVQHWLDRVLPDGFYVVEYESNGEIVATAMATHNPSPLHPHGGELGWVAGSPQHTGQHLGRVVCAAATARFLAAGYRRIYLKTDDWRLPAIKTYLRLGYRPWPYAAGMEARWKTVCSQLAWGYSPIPV